MKYEYLIGIDPGVNTGIAVWNATEKKFESVETVKIHEAMEIVKWKSNAWTCQAHENVKVFVEDARKRKWFGDNSSSKQQGAGSIKRDCTIWEDFLKSLKSGNFDYEMIHPIKGGTKWNSIPGWNGRTSQHARDAAFMVLGK